MITVTLYSRQDCHLCEQARVELENLQSDIPHQLVVIDVDSDNKLKREYGFEVPVVAVGPFRLKAPFGSQELRVTLAAAQDRERHIDMVEASPRLEQLRQDRAWTAADNFSYWISRRYMLVFNLVVAFYLGMSFLAPVLMQAGYETPARWIYRAYSLVCHQLAFRSFFLFGEQLYYPRAEAGLQNVLSYSQASGNADGHAAADLLAARSFVGNEQVGYKIALCQRDIAIYGGILIFGLLFSLSGLRLPPIPWYLWIIFGLAPIAIDGLSQLLSQPPLSFLPYRESTPLYRVLTGFLFGFTTAWFGYPIVEESMRESRQLYRNRRKRAQPSG
jgi:uncharacterized membrane protein